MYNKLWGKKNDGGASMAPRVLGHRNNGIANSNSVPFIYICRRRLSCSDPSSQGSYLLFILLVPGRTVEEEA
jgi:hypothetical protein